MAISPAPVQIPPRLLKAFWIGLFSALFLWTVWPCNTCFSIPPFMLN